MTIQAPCKHPARGLNVFRAILKHWIYPLQSRGGIQSSGRGCQGMRTRIDGLAVAAVEIPAVNRLDGGPAGAVPDGHELAPLPVSRKLQAPCNILARRLKCFSRFPTS